jgi:hypothetical protein
MIPYTGDASLPISIYDTIRTAVLNQQGFSVVSEVLPLAATETATFLIKNPTGSGKVLKLNFILCGLLQSVGSATGNQDVFRLYLDPTVTANGTAVTISNLYSTSSPAASVMTAFSSPTVTANGTKLGVYAVATQGNDTCLMPQHLTRILDPGHSWLFTQAGIVNGASTGIVQLEWIEV